MSNINVKIVDQTITLTNTPLIFSGDINVDHMNFEFDDTWNDYFKTACFYNDESKPYLVELSTNKCIIPKEVLANAGAFYFGVFGVNSDKVLTTQVVKYDVGQGILTTGTIPEPTEELWQQILALVGETLDKVNKIGEEHTEFSEKLNEALETLNTGINNVGQYEWNGTNIRFKKADGTWGDWIDWSGPYAKSEDLVKLSDLSKDLYLVLNPVGSVIKTTTDENPQVIYGGTWELVSKNNPVYTINYQKILNPNGVQRFLFEKTVDVEAKFENEYGYTPNITEVGINLWNADADATERPIIGYDISASLQNINVVFEAPHTGLIRVGAQFIAKDKTKTIYTWRRTK